MKLFDDTKNAYKKIYKQENVIQTLYVESVGKTKDILTKVINILLKGSKIKNYYHKGDVRHIPI